MQRKNMTFVMVFVQFSVAISCTLGIVAWSLLTVWEVSLFVVVMVTVRPWNNQLWTVWEFLATFGCLNQLKVTHIQAMFISDISQMLHSEMPVFQIASDLHLRMCTSTTTFQIPIKTWTLWTGLTNRPAQHQNASNQARRRLYSLNYRDTFSHGVLIEESRSDWWPERPLFS